MLDVEIQVILGLSGFCRHQVIQIVLEIVDLRLDMFGKFRFDARALNLNDSFLSLFDRTEVLLPGRKQVELSLSVFQGVLFRIKALFVGIDGPPVAVILDLSALLEVAVHVLLSLEIRSYTYSKSCITLLWMSTLSCLY